MHLTPLDTLTTTLLLTSVLLCPIPHLTTPLRYAWVATIGSLTYVGWEWWWSVGASPHSTPYDERFHQSFPTL